MYKCRYVADETLLVHIFNGVMLQNIDIRPETSIVRPRRKHRHNARVWP